MKKEHLMAATTIFLWATLPPMTKLLLADFPSMTLLYYSSIIASVALVLFLLLTGRISKLKTYSLRDFMYMTGLGILGEFLYSALYYQGLTLISSTDACILNYLWPITAVIFSCIFLKEKLTISKTAAIMLSFFGVILVTSKGTRLSSFSENSLAGCILCILAAFCYGLFNVLNKMFGKDQWINMTFYFVLTALLAGISCHSTGQLVVPNFFQCLGIFWLGLFIDAIGIVIWAIALQNSEVSYLVNFAYATPVLAMILSTIFLKETYIPVLDLLLFFAVSCFRIKAKNKGIVNKLWDSPMDTDITAYPSMSISAILSIICPIIPLNSMCYIL